MNEKKSGWGGKRDNQTGRPKRADELEVINLFDKSIDREFVVGKLNDLIKKGDIKAITLYLSYIYGKPINRIEQKTDMNITNVKLSDFLDFDEEDDKTE